VGRFVVVASAAPLALVKRCIAPGGEGAFAGHEVAYQRLRLAPIVGVGKFGHAVFDGLGQRRRLPVAQQLDLSR